jgi:hypothetical protein
MPTTSKDKELLAKKVGVYKKFLDQLTGASANTKIGGILAGDFNNLLLKACQVLPALEEFLPVSLGSGDIDYFGLRILVEQVNEYLQLPDALQPTAEKKK